MYVLTYFVSIFIVLQVYDGHSNFLLNLSLSNDTKGSNNTTIFNFKLPIANFSELDDNTTITSSLYFGILVTRPHHLLTP